MRAIQVTQQEIFQAMRPAIYKNKKAYTRKAKHRAKY